MSSLLLSREHLDFLLYEWLQAEALTDRPRFSDHSRETFDAVVDLAERVATEHFAPANRAGDINPAHFDGKQVQVAPEIVSAVEVFVETGLMAASQDRDLGGMELPLLIEMAAVAWLQAGSAAVCGFQLLTAAGAKVIKAHGTPDMVKRYVRPMFDGRFFGTMCLSEPHAGSSLAEIRTKALPQADGTFRIVGNKMWISGGEHEVGENIIHLVLAKLPDAPPGVKGISLFLVPRKLLDEDGKPGERNDVALAGVNHKMGSRGFPNTLLNFGEGAFSPGGQAGAIGWMVGKPHRGLEAMFLMMNEARINVGLSATAIGYTAFLHALEYARGRPQGYLPGPRAKDAKQVPIIEHSDVRRMLLAQKSYVQGALALVLYCAKLVDDERTAIGPSSRQDAALLLEVLTPVTKSWPSQWCQEACSLAIQVHGGAGYTIDYPVEQFYRDNRLNPIHEGTQGIHGIDLLGRKVSLEDGRGFRLFVDRVEETLERARPDDGLAGYAEALGFRLANLSRTTDTLVAQENAAVRLANSNAYLEAFGHIVIAWLWLEQMLAAHSDSGLHAGLRMAGQYFFRWELPRVDNLLDQLCAGDDTCLSMNEDWF